MLLATVGRHFAIAHKTLLVVGRSQKENVQLAQLSRAGDVELELAYKPGPLSLLRGSYDPGMFMTAASITVRHSKAWQEKQVPVTLRRRGTSFREELVVDPISDPLLEDYRIA